MAKKSSEMKDHLIKGASSQLDEITTQIAQECLRDLQEYVDTANTSIQPDVLDKILIDVDTDIGVKFKFVLEDIVKNSLNKVEGDQKGLHIANILVNLTKINQMLTEELEKLVVKNGK